MVLNFGYKNSSDLRKTIAAVVGMETRGWMEDDKVEILVIWRLGFGCDTEVK